MIKENQKNIFIVIAFLSLIASSFLIEAFKSQNKDPIKTIKFWHYWTGEEKVPLEKLVHKFNEEKHGFKVDVLSISMPRKKVLTSIVGNVAPDIVHLHGDFVTDFALRNALAKIDTNIFPTNELIPVYLEMLKINGTQWAMPFITGSEAMYLNKDLLDKWSLAEPETLDDIVHAFDLSLAKDDNSVAFIPSWPSWFSEFVPSYFGGSWVDENGKPSANSKENIEAWEWIEKNFVSKLSKDKVLSFTEGFGAYQSPDNPFYSGKVAIEASGVWERKLIKIFAPKMNVIAKPFPGKVPNATNLSVNALAIPKNAKYKKEALEFMKWLCRQDNSEFIALSQKQFTPYKNHTEEFFRKHENEFIETFIELAKSPNAKFLPHLHYLTRYKKEIHTAYDKMVRQQKTAQEALDELQEKILKLSD